MSITTDRDVFVGAHLTYEQKEAFRLEALRRRKSMSALLAEIIEDWLLVAPDQQVEEIRSNKRGIVMATDAETGITIRMDPNAFKKAMRPLILSDKGLLPPIPGHSHSIGSDGLPTCGCHFEEDVPLPFQD